MNQRYDDLLPGMSQERISGLLDKLDTVARNAVAKTLGHIPPKEFVISHSGGIDSSILVKLADLCLREGVNVVTVGKEGSHDLRNEIYVDTLGGKSTSRIVVGVSAESIEAATLKVQKMIGESSLAQLEDCVAFWLIAEATKGRVGSAKYIVSANGPDELFCGYDRFRRILDEEGYSGASKEIRNALGAAQFLKHKVGVVLENFGLSGLDPFLTEEFERCCLEMPIESKILACNDRLRKRIWRAYGRKLGLDERTVLKPKKAMQYSMGLHPTVLRVVKSIEAKQSRIQKT